MLDARARASRRPARWWTRAAPGGDRAGTINVSTIAADRRRRGRRDRGEARQPRRLVAVRVGRPPRGAGREGRAAARRRRRGACARRGIGFMFAPVFHAAMAHAAVPRREMGIPTVFNFLGPLTNPARPAGAGGGRRRRRACSRSSRASCATGGPARSSSAAATGSTRSRRRARRTVIESAAGAPRVRAGPGGARPAACRDRGPHGRRSRRNAEVARAVLRRRAGARPRHRPAERGRRARRCRHGRGPAATG